MKLFALAIFLTIFTACVDFPDPENTPVESYSFSNNGMDRKGFANDYISDSLLINIRDNYQGVYMPGFQVLFEVTEGGGEVDNTEIYTDFQGNAYTRWKLGTSGTEQLVEAQIYSPAGKYLATIPFRAVGFLPGAWNTVTLQPDLSFSDMAADSLNEVTFAIGSSGLYIQGERYFDWYYSTSYNINSPRRIILGTDQKFYLSTWYGQLFKSSDHGATWQESTKPWPDHSYYYFMTLTKDNYIWATASGRPLRCSRDGGVTWTDASAGLQSEELLGDIYRLTDGTLFFLSLNCHLYKSVDDGHTWTGISVSGYPLKLYVTEKDEIILFNQEAGISIVKSTDKGENFLKKHSVWPAFGTLMDHTVYKRGGTYYILIPGYGILVTDDFERFETIFNSDAVNDMFMDDEGVIIARELGGQQVHYRDTQ